MYEFEKLKLVEPGVKKKVNKRDALIIFIVIADIEHTRLIARPNNT